MFEKEETNYIRIMVKKLYKYIKFAIVNSAFLTSTYCVANGTIYSNNINTLQVMVDNDFLSPTVVTMGKGQTVRIGFDEMSHETRRLTYHITHCNPDWTPSAELLESDYLEGFSDNVIDNYSNSINTTVLFTHYHFSIPNEQCQLKLSGNYLVTVTDDDTGERLLEARFMMVDPKMTLRMEMRTNTDIDVNKSHQQLSMAVNFNGLRVTNSEEQLYTIVTQNDRESTKRVNVEPDMKTPESLTWQHNRKLIFDGGNEYRKYEVLSLSHTTMGIEEISWDGHNYQAYPYISMPRQNYIYDEDADGAFYIRNSDNIDNDICSDYVYVNYRLSTKRQINRHVVVDGKWTTHADKNKYVAIWDDEQKCYTLSILQKQGYYSFQYLTIGTDGKEELLATEGNFHETENSYQAYVYYKPSGERYWQLVGYRQLR